MSKHPIPDWLRSQFSLIEDEVRKLGPCGVFTQMRTVTQTYFEQQAAAPQPPALGGEREVFIQRYAESSGEGGGVYAKKDGDLCDYHHVTRLHAEISSVRQVLAATRDARDAAQYQAYQLKARRDELEGLLQMFIDNSEDRDVVELSRNALSKPAGSEQV